jgi:mannose-6-phosphate isomerase
MLRIQPKLQNYEWGKKGRSSKVAQLASKGNCEPTIEERPYAELWMGTHPTAPSVLAGGEPLKSVLDSNTLGNDIYQKYGDLPFLFKVLSIETALSIQAHPDKQLAQRLFTQFPNIYKDANHKPEMAIALTDFEAFIGFRPLEEIAVFLNKYSEFRTAIGNDVSSDFISFVTKCTESTSPNERKMQLKIVFSALQNQSPLIINQLLSSFFKSLNPSSELEMLLVRLNQQYPGDVGIFCAFMLNYLKLKPSQALFLAANEPHAYISGDCIECMAASDNVVRSGLTPKFKDVKTLVEMLSVTLTN